jgi:hypothetical protein
MMRRSIIGLVLIGVITVSLYSAVDISYSSGTILQQINDIIEQVQIIRGLHFKERPKVVVMTRTEAMKAFGGGGGSENLIEELTYKMTLLLPANYSFERAKKEEEAGWIALTVGNTIYVVEENFESNPDVARRAIAHELVHVLQKQWFNARYDANTFDGTLAVRALVEGDADLVADIYCEKNGIPIIKIRSLTGNPIADIGDFSYVFGDRFVRYLYEKGGWKLVNSAYRRYPSSTAQVMHPALYFENFTPLNVSLSVPKNWTVFRNDRMGEFYVYLLLLDSARLSNETAWRVASSWLGDRLILAKTPNSYVLLWKVVFSNDNSAKEFGETLRRLARGDNYARFEVSISGRSTFLKAVRGVEG